MRSRHLVRVVAPCLLALSVAGCGLFRDPLDGTGGKTPPPQTGLVIGEVPDAPLDLGEGRTLAGCEGDTTEILCVYGGGDVVGTVVLGSGPAEGADADGWLMADAASWLDSVRVDRAASCDGREFQPLDPTPARVAGRDGVLVGFSILDADGTVTDMTRSWRATDGATLAWVTANAATGDACAPEVEQPLDPALLDNLVGPLGEFVAAAEAPALS